MEDDKDYVEVLKKYFAAYEKESCDKFNISIFGDGLAFLDGYGQGADIILMDIEMPHLNGMDAARRLRATDGTVNIIFVTNLAQYAINGYEVDACGFMVKPVSYAAFCMQLNKTLNRIKLREESEVVLKGKGAMHRVPVNSIFYVEAVGAELFFHTSGGTISARGPLYKFAEGLAAGNFAFANNCYFVNLRYVSAINKDTVTVNGEELKISRGKKKSFTDAFTNYLGRGGNG